MHYGFFQVCFTCERTLRTCTPERKKKKNFRPFGDDHLLHQHWFAAHATSDMPPPPPPPRNPLSLVGSYRESRLEGLSDTFTGPPLRTLHLRLLSCRMDRTCARFFVVRECLLPLPLPCLPLIGAQCWRHPPGGGAPHRSANGCGRP